MALPVACVVALYGLQGDLIGSHFPSDWKLTKCAIASEPKEHGTAVVEMDEGSGAKPSRLSFELHKPPGDRKMVLTIWLKGTQDGQWISIDAFAEKTVNGQVRPAQIQTHPGEGFVTTEYAKMKPDWQRFVKTIDVSRSSERLIVNINNPWKQKLFVAAPSLKPGQAETCDLDGPGVIRAHEHIWIDPSASSTPGVVTFPVPISYGDQAPIGLKLESEPAGAIRSYNLTRRPDGLNWLCNLTLNPVKQKTKLGWEALVLVRPHLEVPLPLASTPEAPPEEQPWLKRSACAQIDSPLILAKAKELEEGDPDIETYARRVATFTCNNRGGNEPWTRLDAEMSLLCAGGGTCTNRANLAAALLRIHGIPARTVAHLPTWCFGEPLFTHWLVEYWHPHVGWVSLESTWGQFEPPPYSTAIVAISSIADEDESFDPIQARWVLPGAPMWSVPHVANDLTPSKDMNQQENWASPEARLAPGKQFDELFRRATGGFERSMRSREIADPKRYERLSRAVAKKDISAIQALAFQRP